MSGPKIRNKNGKCERNLKRPDGTYVPDARSNKGLAMPHDTPAFLRMTTEGVVRLDAMVRDLGFAGRARLVEHGLDVVQRLEDKLMELGARDRMQLLDEALVATEQLETVAVKLNYRDRHDVLADAIASLLFLAKCAPLPKFAKIEDAPMLSPPAKSDQPNLL